MLAVIEKFDGGPVGLDNLGAAIGEESGTIEEVVEPYLIQQGLLMRTPRGRVATNAAYLHFGLTPPVATEAPGDSDKQGAITAERSDAQGELPIT